MEEIISKAVFMMLAAVLFCAGIVLLMTYQRELEELYHLVYMCSLNEYVSQN